MQQVIRGFWTIFMSFGIVLAFQYLPEIYNNLSVSEAKSSKGLSFPSAGDIMQPVIFDTINFIARAVSLLMFMMGIWQIASGIVRFESPLGRRYPSPRISAHMLNADAILLPMTKTAFDKQNLLREKFESNKSEVVGWEYALREGSINESDLESMEAAELQDRIDTANPLAAEVYQLRELIPIFSGTTTKAHRRRHDTMVKLLKELREQPDEMHRKARAAHADEAIEDAHAAIKSVEKLDEG